MDEIALRHGGRGNGTVRVSHAPGDAATVMELTGGPLSSLYVYGVIDTPDRLEQGRILATLNYGGRRLRAVVPKQYTHVRLAKSRNSLFPRWRLGFGGSGSLPELRGRASGSHPDVLRHTGERAALRLEVGAGYAVVTRRSPSGMQDEELHRAMGPFRGTIELPGPGLYEIDCLVEWSAILL
jgi:hypothetical protein